MVGFWFNNLNFGLSIFLLIILIAFYVRALVIDYINENPRILNTIPDWSLKPGYQTCKMLTASRNGILMGAMAGGISGGFQGALSGSFIWHMINGIMVGLGELLKN